MDQELQIQTNERKDMGWGFVDEMRVQFPSFMSQEELVKNKELLDKVAEYCKNKISYLLLTDGKSFLDKYQEEFPVDIKEDAVYLKYGEGKTALCTVLYYQGDYEVRPYIQFQMATSRGFTLAPGHFSDFIIKKNMGGKIIGYTKDFMSMHFPVAKDYIQMYTNMYEGVLHRHQLPADFELFSDELLQHTQVFNVVKEEIKEEIKRLTHINSSNQIDTLEANKKTVGNLISDYNIRSSLSIGGAKLTNISIELGKPLPQVEKFIKKNKIKN